MNQTLLQERERKAQKASKPRGTEQEAQLIDSKIADELKHLTDRKVFARFGFNFDFCSVLNFRKRVNEGEFDVKTGMTSITKVRVNYFQILILWV